MYRYSMTTEYRSTNPELLPRLERLERLLAEVSLALLRAGTDQDGSYGYKSTRQVLLDVAKELKE